MTLLQVRVVTALRRRAKKRNMLDVPLETVAADLGDDATAEDVRLALRDLIDDGFFLDRPICDGRSFRGRLPS
jgi:hypothetical protein